MESFVLKGDFVESQNPSGLNCYENAFLVCIEGKSKGVFTQLPEEYKNLPLKDESGHLILCGLVDLHLHAPQYTFRGMGMDMELLDWLNHYTFPEEGKYAQMDYAQKAYGQFVGDLRNSATTRFSAFATAHLESTLYLMEELEKTGLSGLVGLVSMNRNAPPFLCQENPMAEVGAWLKASSAYQRIKPILTPRFIPSCSDDLMRDLGVLQQETALPLQSHLSENMGEMAWVQELLPQSKHYGDGYEGFGCFGTAGKTVMAHCVHSCEEELALMKKNQVFVAHCPDSNSNLSSGIAPIRRYLDMGLDVGLGSDVAGGHDLSLFRQMAAAIQVSKLRWRLVDESLPPLTVAEVYYLATKGGGKFFGDLGAVGSLEEGYEFDVIVVKEEETVLELSLPQRLERVIYLGGTLLGKYVSGRAIDLKS